MEDNDLIGKSRLHNYDSTTAADKIATISEGVSSFTANPSTEYLIKDEDDEEENEENVDGTNNKNDKSMEISDRDGAAHDHPTTSLIGTFINFIKGNIGTGVLAMPDAVKNAGLFFGTSCILLLGLLSTYCCHQLMHAYDQVSHGKPMGYSRVVELTFKKAPGILKKFAVPSRYLVDVAIIFTQLGFCCVYILFCSKMVKEVVDGQISPGTGPPIQIYATAVLGLLIPYCFVTTLKALSIFTLFANVVCIASLVIVLQHVFRHLQSIENVDWYQTNISKLPLFFGTTMFAFESIGLILPLENKMKERREFHGWNGLLSMSMACIACLYAAVGFYGYLAFGSESKMILSNMPRDKWLYILIKLMYACSIFISINLQLYVPVQVMFPTLKKWISRPWFDRFGEYIFRILLIIFTYALAVGIPCLELMISLIGALCSSSLALIFPPIIELVCCLHKGYRDRLTPGLIVKNVLILLTGIFGACVGTFVSIQSIVKARGCGA